MVLAAAALLTFCGCGDGKQPDVDTGSGSSSAVQKYPVGSYERRAADNAALGIEEWVGEAIDFGSDSIFAGVQVESDENGEIVCTEKDGVLWCRLTDRRFGSYSAFVKFVGQRSETGEVGRLSRYFTEADGNLYFVVGVREHNVKDICRYYIDDASKLTVTVAHTSDSCDPYRVVRSEIDFVRENGLWKLDRLTVYRF